MKTALRSPHRKYIYRLGLLGLLILVILMGLIYFFVVPKAVEGLSGALNPAVDTFDSTQLDTYVGLNTPDAATNFHGAVYNFTQSRIISLSFHVPPSDANDFLIALGFTLPLAEGFYPFHPNSFTLTSNDWWKPESAAHFVGGSFVKSESFYDVLVDTADPTSYIIYLMIERS